MFAYSLLDKLLFPFATDLSKTHASSAATSAIKRFSNLPYQFNWFFAFGDIQRFQWQNLFVSVVFVYIYQVMAVAVRQGQEMLQI